MQIKRLDTVVLQIDLPKQGLKQGDIGTVVELYGAEATEVEFVTATGTTQAVVTLYKKDIRLAKSDEIPTVRLMDAA